MQPCSWFGDKIALDQRLGLLVDICRFLANAENMAILCHLALGLIKQEQPFKGSINGRRLRAGWDNDYLLKIVALK